MKKWLLLFAVFASITLAWCGTKTETSKNKDALPQETVNTQVKNEQRIISIQASRFQFTPGVITVNQWENIALAVQDIDTTHGAYFMNMQTITDTQWNIILDTSVPWTYTFACATMCGNGHREMQGTVIVQ